MLDSISDLKTLGASIPEGEQINSKGYINLNLSPEIDYKEARRISTHIPKYIASQKDFYDVKAISYFEKDYSYLDFLMDLKKCDPSELPFYIEKHP